VPNEYADVNKAAFKLGRQAVVSSS
jgi:hypothetical protein